jgi:hypothetical protein
VQLAIATHIPVSVWLQEPNEIIVTAIDELNRQAERMKRK